MTREEERGEASVNADADGVATLVDTLPRFTPVGSDAYVRAFVRLGSSLSGYGNIVGGGRMSICDSMSLGSGNELMR